MALEQAREASFEHQSQDNVAEVNLEDRPTFGFADSESATPVNCTAAASDCRPQSEVASTRIRQR